MALSYWERIEKSRITRRRLIRGAALSGLGLVSAYTLACGGGSDKGGTSTSQGSGGGGKVTTGGKLTVAQTLEPSTLDPTIVVSGGDDVYARPHFDYLLARSTTGVGEDVYDPTHSLATKFELVDPLTVVLTLRQGVKYHDGNPFVAADVAWNMERTKDPALNSVNRQAYLVVNKVETPNDSTATFKLTQPYADLIVNLGGRGGQMLSPKAVEKLGKQFGAAPVGTGPFVFKEFVSGSHLTVTKNPNYWGKDANGIAKPYLDTLTLKPIPDSTTRVAALATGDVDVTGFDPKDLQTIQGNSKVNTLILKGLGTASTIIANRDLKPVDNVDLRRALVWALDPLPVNKAVYFDLAIPADGGVHPTAVWAHTAVPDRPKYDPQKAKQFLTNAGYPNGLSIDVITYSAPLIQQQTQIYQQQWKAIGIDAKINVNDVGAATQAFFTGKNVPVYSTSWGAGSAPDGLVRGIIGDAAFYNPSTQKNPQIQDLLDKAVAIYDQNQRKQLYAQIDKLYLDQALWVPMLYSVGLISISKRVQSQEQMYYGYYIQHFEDLWVSG